SAGTNAVVRLYVQNFSQNASHARSMATVTFEVKTYKVKLAREMTAVCIENLIRIDQPKESPNLSAA
ncbi:MAG: hypothetical protein WCB78_24580, partial [Pseudolabrys sp.]